MENIRIYSDPYSIGNERRQEDCRRTKDTVINPKDYRNPYSSKFSVYVLYCRSVFPISPPLFRSAALLLWLYRRALVFHISGGCSEYSMEATWSCYIEIFHAFHVATKCCPASITIARWCLSLATRTRHFFIFIFVYIHNRVFSSVAAFHFLTL